MFQANQPTCSQSTEPTAIMSVFNNSVLKTVFSDETVRKLEMLKISTPEKITFQGEEYYCIPRAIVVTSRDDLEMNKSYNQYAKILIFSYMFGIGKDCIIEGDGRVLPFNCDSEETCDFDDIYQEEFFGSLRKCQLQKIILEFDELLEYLYDNDQIDEFKRYNFVYKLQLLLRQCFDFEDGEDEEDDEEDQCSTPERACPLCGGSCYPSC